MKHMQHDYKAPSREIRAGVTTEDQYCKIIHAHRSNSHRICGNRTPQGKWDSSTIRAYVVDSITKMTKVKVPEEIRAEFSASAKWPTDRYHGEIEILLGIEELAL
jgi:hypothetical protein